MPTITSLCVCTVKFTTTKNTTRRGDFSTWTNQDTSSYQQTRDKKGLIYERVSLGSDSLFLWFVWCYSGSKDQGKHVGICDGHSFAPEWEKKQKKEESGSLSILLYNGQGVCVCVLLKAPLCNKVSLISTHPQQRSRPSCPNVCLHCLSVWCVLACLETNLDLCLLYSIKRLHCPHYFLIKTERNPALFLFNSRPHRPIEEVVWRALENEKPCFSVCYGLALEFEKPCPRLDI